MAALDVFTISVASTLFGRTLSRVIMRLVKADDMEGMDQKLGLYHPTQKSTCSSRGLHRLDCAHCYAQLQRPHDHNLA